MKWKLTPEEPDDAMYEAATDVVLSTEDALACHRAMLSAAPDPLEDAELMARVVAAVKETRRRYVIEGTSEREFGGPPFRAPWYLIDAATAEPEVNWPGELVGEFDDPQKAYDAKWGLVVRAAITAMNGE